MKIQWFNRGRTKAPHDDFFLPELCEPEALLSLVLLAELLVLVLVLSEPMVQGFNWVRLALTSLFVQWIVLLSAALLCSLRPLLARLRAALAGCLCCALVVALTLGCTAVADHYELGGPLPRDGEVNLYLRHALISLIMSALLLRYFYLQSQWRRQQQAELQARIESLQARIRPHFLFNSLNSIASLVAIDPVKAEQAVLDLSDLFRASLAKPGNLVAWSDELELARRYLSIEHYRLGDRLQLEWQVGDRHGGRRAAGPADSPADAAAAAGERADLRHPATHRRGPGANRSGVPQRGVPALREQPLRGRSRAATVARHPAGPGEHRRATGGTFRPWRESQRGPP